LYIDLIEEMRNYNEEAEYDIQNDMKDYFEYYFIKIKQTVKILGFQ